MRRPQPRHEIRIRQAETTDAARCTTISTTYTTTHVWQLDARSDGDDVRIAFRLVRLPRELTLAAEQRPPAKPSRRGTLWLVAEQVNTAAPAGRPHGTLRPSRGASAMQLNLPDAPPGRAAPAERSAASVVGYVGAYHAAGDACAYLQSLAVDPTRRRQGIAAALLAEARRWAAAQGAERLIADVAARNYPALRLLQRTGFAFCGFNDRCYPKDEVAVFLSVELR